MTNTETTIKRSYEQFNVSLTTKLSGQVADQLPSDLKIRLTDGLFIRLYDPLRVELKRLVYGELLDMGIGPAWTHRVWP